MELEKLSPPNSPEDLHYLPVGFHNGSTEFCEENVEYLVFKSPHSSTRQTLKNKVSPWCIAAVVFACLYFIALVTAAIMIARVCQQQEVINLLRAHEENGTAKYMT